MTGYRKTLEPSDLPALNPRNTTDWNYPKFDRVWSQVLSQWRANMSSDSECAPIVSPTRTHPVSPSQDCDKPLLSGNRESSKATTENPKLEQASEKPTTESSSQEKKRAAKAKAKQEDADLKRYPSVILVLLRVFWRTLLKAHLCKLAQDFIQYLNPVWLGYCILCFLYSFAFHYISLSCSLRMLVVFMKSSEAPIWRGFFIAFQLFITTFSQSMCFQRLFYNHVRDRDPNAGGTRVGSVSQGTNHLLSRTTAVDRWRDGEHNGGGHPAHSGFHVLLLCDLELPAAGHYRHGAAVPHARPVGVCRTRFNDLVHFLQLMDGHIST